MKTAVEISLYPLDAHYVAPIKDFIERLHRTLLNEHFRLKGREKFYESVAEMQVDLDAYLVIYNTKRPHQGRGMNGMTPLQAFQNGLKLTPKTERKEEPKEAA